MVRNSVDCIDCGSEYCPCKLAESGQCLICSQCQGKKFCDCLNWKGVCVFQDFHNNNNKAKEGRRTYSCKVNKVKIYNNQIYMIKFKTPHKLALDLVKPGSYIFVKTDKNNYFDIPISIMNSNVENDEVSILVEVKGIKTNKLSDIKEGKNIIIRGPYWNGVFGLRNIEKKKEGKALVLSRAIGIAPMVPVIKRLKMQNNDVSVIIDESAIDSIAVKDIVEEYSIENRKMVILEKDRLSEYCRVVIKESLEKGADFIHIAGADILTYRVIAYLHEIGRDDVKLSCCNNFKMCCGEGICGACTVRYAGHKVRRYCKEQTDPRNIFEGRRLI